MAVTQYIGSRYVPLFADPIDWDITRAYEPLTIVYYQGNSYTSKQSVPTGIDVTNTTFWALTGNYNAQVEQYRREVQTFDGRITANAQAIADEVTARMQEDTAIRTLITNLTNDLTTETSNREAADTAIRNEITQEVSDLNTVIDGKVATLNQTISDNVATLNQTISDDVAHLEQQDSAINDRIDSIIEETPRYTAIGLRYKDSKMVLMGTKDFDNFVDIGEPFGTLGNEGNAKNLKEINDILYIFNDSNTIYYTDDLETISSYPASELIGTVPTGYACWAYSAFKIGTKIFAIAAYANQSNTIETAVGTSWKFDIVFHECYLDDDGVRIKCDTPVYQWPKINLPGNSYIDPDVAVYNGQIYLAVKNETTSKFEFYTNTNITSSDWARVPYTVRGYGMEACKLVSTDDSLMCFFDGYSFSPDGVPIYTDTHNQERQCVVKFRLAYFTLMDGRSIANNTLPYHVCKQVRPTLHNAVMCLKSKHLINAANHINESNTSTQLSTASPLSFWEVKANMSAYVFTNCPGIACYQQGANTGQDITLQYDPLFNNGSESFSFVFAWATCTSAFKAGNGLLYNADLAGLPVDLVKTPFTPNMFNCSDKRLFAHIHY